MSLGGDTAIRTRSLRPRYATSAIRPRRTVRGGGDRKKCVRADADKTLLSYGDDVGVSG
jgi:hypothetical protein